MVEDFILIGAKVEQMSDDDALEIVSECLKRGEITEEAHNYAFWEKLRNVCAKHTKKKPYFQGDGYADGYMVYETWICPNCDKEYEVDYDEYDYCPNCGQAIDWKKDEVNE